MIHLLPHHEFLNGNFPSENEACSMNSEILSSKLCLDELLYVRSKVVGKNWSSTWGNAR